jgi:hypothetical protein
MSFEQVPLVNPRFVKITVGEGNPLDVAVLAHNNFVDLYSDDATALAETAKQIGPYTRGVNPILVKPESVPVKRRLAIDSTADKRDIVLRYVEHKSAELNSSGLDQADIIRLGDKLLQEVE